MARRDDDFWEVEEDWSRRKHDILSYYLHPASPKLRSVSPDGRVIITDGFAGRGKYKDNAPGSPILMGQLSDKCQMWQNPVNLRIYNVEPNEEIYTELNKNTQKWVEEGSMVNIYGYFSDVLPLILAESLASPIFAFLDPFRPSHLLFSDFLPLISRRGITELCFVLHTPNILRMIRAVATGQQEQSAHQSSITTLNDIFGSDCWMRFLSLDSIDPFDLAECFGNELAYRSQDRPPYICIHPIEARYKVGLKYHIVFFTRNRHGVALMNDAFCKEARTVYSQAKATEQTSLLDLMDIEPLPDAPPVELTNEERIRSLIDSTYAVG